MLLPLGSFAGGVAQGLQAGSQLRSQALQIQQYQMQLDAAKRDLAAQAAAFQGVGTQQPSMSQFGATQVPNQPSAPQPPMPGQSSVPAARVAPPAGGPPATPGPATAPPPSGAGQPTSSQADQFQQGQFDPFSAVMRIAADIKRRNPDIDPQTLFAATGDMVKMMQGVAPDMRAQLAWAADMLRAQTSTTNTQTRVAGEERDTDVRAGVDMAKIQAQMQETNMRVQAAQQRLVYTQGQINQRFQQGQQSKGATTAQRTALAGAQAKFKAAQTRYTQLQSNLRAGINVDPAQVQKSLDDMNAAAQNVMDVTNKIANQPPDQAPADSSDQLGSELGGGAWQPPAGAPSAKGVTDGSPLQQNGKTVAVARGGKWVQP